MDACNLKVTVDTSKAEKELRRLFAGTRQFYARPCDEPRKGWCVEEVQLGVSGAKWKSTTYVPVLTRMSKCDGSTAIIEMTRKQAERESEFWNHDRDARGKNRKNRNSRRSK
jgi:hypothetical protein